MTVEAEPMRMGTRAHGLLFALLAGLAMSTNGLLLRLIDAADQWQIIVFRSGSLGVAIVLILAIRYRLRLLSAFRALGWTGLVAGLVLGLSYPSYVLSLLNTTVANALFLMSTSPVIAALLGLIVLGEQVRGITWLAIFGTVVGVLIMVYDGLEGGGMLGNAFALFNALLYAVYTLLARRNRRVDMMPALAIGGFVASGIGALNASSFALTPHDFGLCLFMGGVQLTLGFTLITLAAQRAPVAEVNLVAMIEMVAGPIIVWLGVGEVPSDLTLLGGAIVLMSVGGLALSGMFEVSRSFSPRGRMRAGEVPAVATGAVGPRRDGRGDFTDALREAEARASERETLLAAKGPVEAEILSATRLADEDSSAPTGLANAIPSAAHDASAASAERANSSMAEILATAQTAEAPVAHAATPPAVPRASGASGEQAAPPAEEPAPRGPLIRPSVERQLQIALEPMLRAWVEANLHRIVAPILRREIRAIVRKTDRPH
ncbi:MAG: EamA family transporter [Alphaproteobacteria bacterium]